MKYQRSAILVLITILLVCVVTPLFAQGERESEAFHETRTAVDALGRTVTISGEINRVMVVGRAAVMPADALYLFPAAMEMEVLLAKTDQGLGDFFDLIRPDSEHDYRLGQQVGAEEILAHKPDLVLTKANNYDSIVKLLEPFSVPMFVMDLEDADSWKQEIVQLGILLNDTETPQRIIAGFEMRERLVDAQIADLPEEQRPRVLIMQAAAADGVTAFSVSPRNWIQSKLTQRAGGNPVWLEDSPDSNAWRKVSFEQIAAWQPEKIIIISYKSSAEPFLQTIRTHAQWQNLDAVKNGSVVAAPADVLNYFQSDSRWILALQWLAAELHPDRFPDFSMEQEIRSFYREFYGIAEHTIQQLISLYRASVGIH